MVPARTGWPDHEPSALLAALEVAVGDAVQPGRAVHQPGDRADQGDRTDEARARGHGHDEHADRLVGLAVDQLPQAWNHRAAHRGDDARGVVTLAAPRLDQCSAHPWKYDMARLKTTPSPPA